MAEQTYIMARLRDLEAQIEQLQEFIRQQQAIVSMLYEAGFKAGEANVHRELAGGKQNEIDVD